MNRNVYKTNNGLLLLFETKNRNFIYGTSDIESAYGKLFSLEGDSELYVGRELVFNEINYKITFISGYSDSQSALVGEDLLDGMQYKYSYVMRMIVEPT